MAEQIEILWSGLEERVGYRFADRGLLAAALTHRSFANESRTPELPDNERLEFLGDAVLNLVVGHELYLTHGAVAEGELSRLRAELVSAPSLAGLARELRLGECLRLGRGEDRSGGRDKESLLADSLEALVGAVFIDSGYAAAANVVRGIFRGELAGGCGVARAGLQDAASGVSAGTAAASPRISSGRGARTGPSPPLPGRGADCRHRAGRGEGPTKKRAEQDAARQALEQLATGYGGVDA